MLKMRAVITLLVLLLSMCGSHTLSTQTEVHKESQSTGAAAAVTTEKDISAELRELRDMVVEVKVTLSFTQNELLDTKDLLNKVEAKNGVQDAEMTIMKIKMMKLIEENSAQESELRAVKTRLTASETVVVNLRKEAAAQRDDLRSVTERLATTETDMEHVKNGTAAQEAELTEVNNRLATTETDMEHVKNGNAEQEAELTVVNNRLAATETDVVNLEKEITDRPKVAFSAGLSIGFVGSEKHELDVVFTNVITNVGQAYNSSTGFFTAPVRGVYYFRFTVADVLYFQTMAIRMFKNGERLMYLTGYGEDWKNSYLSGGLTLQLEVGDVVHLQLPAGHNLYEDASNYSTFSGFLLFDF